MKAIAITIIVFISVVVVLTVFVTLFNKTGSKGDGDHGGGGHHNKIHKRSTTSGQMNLHMGNGMSAADNGMATMTTASVFTSMSNGGGGGGF